jgi:hypothetical protein
MGYGRGWAKWVAMVYFACTCSAFAGSGDAKATAVQVTHPVEQAAHSFDPLVPLAAEPARPFELPSKWYGLWEPTEIFNRDARCAPTPWAPRGYGFPKKLAPFRMDYAPYRVRDCGFGSVHGPALWWRVHRDPCCEPLFGSCRCCNRAVDPQ